MSWSEGTLTYGYTAKIDLTDIVEKIISKLPGENNEWYLEDEDIIIRQDVKTGYKAWNCNATLESPAEHEVELDTMVSEDDVNYAVFCALNTTGKVFVRLDIDDESNWDSDDADGPDPDMAYEQWRDRQFEED